MPLLWLLILIVAVAIVVTVCQKSGLDPTFKQIIFYVGLGGTGLYILYWLYGITHGGEIRMW